MRDVIRDAMTRPDCILGVVPDGGGMWLSPLRPDTPRNFAEKPEEWNDAMTAANQIGSDDWSFQIKMNVLSQIQQASGEIFNNDSGSPLKIYGDLIASGSAAFYLRNYVELETWTGKHELQLDVVSGNATLYVDGTLVATKPTGLSTLNFTRASKTSADIEIEFVEFRNLTTSETVWQASHDELYETNNPWPSSTPRNFAEEPATWYDAVAVGYDAIGDHDCEFEISYKNNVDYPGQIFYSNSQNGSINLNFISGNPSLYSSFKAFDEQYASIVVPLDAGVQNAGSHTVKFKRQNGTAEAWVDGRLVKSVTSTLGNKPLYANTIPMSDLNGNIFYIRLTDLTTGRTVWSYPSEAELVRLLTKTNVRTDRGVFEAADESKIAGIATPLDFRGNTTSKTFIARAFCPAHDPASGKLYIHPFFGQGQISSGATAFTFQFSLWEECRSGKSSQLFPAISTGTDMPGANITGVDGYLNQWHTYAMVVDYRGDSCYIRVFVDGTMLRERIVSGTPVWNTPAAATAQETTVGVRRDPNASYYAGSLTRVSYALVFDRALTAAEIAALS